MAIRTAKETGNEDAEAIGNNNLGRVYESFRDFKKAIQFYRLSLSIAKKTENKKTEATAYNNLASAHQSLGDFKEAVDFYH